MKKKTAKVNFTKGEKILIFSCMFFVLSIILIQVFCAATAGNLSLSIEKLKYEISEQEKKNLGKLISEGKKKPILQFDLQGNFIREWHDVNEVPFAKNSACCKNFSFISTFISP
jgi:uncharacterized membrane protein YvbJ